MRFADVLAVGVEPGGRRRSDEPAYQMIAGSGERAVIRAADWKDGDALVAALRAAVPESLFFDTPPAMRLNDPA